MIGETPYEDPLVAQAVAWYLRGTRRPVLGVLEWPLRGNRPCPAVSVAPPYHADAYRTALTEPPRVLLTLPRRGDPVLRTPWGEPVDRLAGGCWTVVVQDGSPRAGVRLLGPGVARATGGPALGRFVWRVALATGSYRAASADGAATVRVAGGTAPAC